MYFFLVYTETFALSLHLASLLEADQEYGIIVLNLLSYHSTQWADWAHTEMFMWTCSLLIFPGRGEIAHSVKNHKLKSSLFMLGVFGYVGFSNCLMYSHLLTLLTMVSGIALLSNAQLGAISCLKHGKAGLSSCCEWLTPLPPSMFKSPIWPWKTCSIFCLVSSSLHPAWLMSQWLGRANIAELMAVSNMVI